MKIQEIRGFDRTATILLIKIRWEIRCKSLKEVISSSPEMSATAQSLLSCLWVRIRQNLSLWVRYGILHSSEWYRNGLGSGTEMGCIQAQLA